MRVYRVLPPVRWLVCLLLLPVLIADEVPTSEPPGHSRDVLTNLQRIFQDLYTTVQPPTAQGQFAVMTLNDAGFNQAEQFDPCLSSSSFSDANPINYVIRRPQKTGRYISHAERMIFENFHNPMVNRYRMTHGTPPTVIYLFTVNSPCLSDPTAPTRPSCAQLIADTARNNPNIRYYVGFYQIYGRDRDRISELWAILGGHDNLVFEQVDSSTLNTPSPRDELRLRKRQSADVNRDVCWFDLRPLDDGSPPMNTWLVIRNHKHVDQCLYSRDRDDSFDNFDCNEGYTDQHFKLLSDEGNKVLIKGRDSGKCLHAAQYGFLGHGQCYFGSQDEQWELVDDGNTGAFRLKAPLFEKCAFLNDDDDLGIYDCGYEDQLWHFDPVGMYTFPVNSWIEIINVIRHERCLGTSGERDLVHNTCNSFSQVQNHFQLIPVSDTYFKIESRQFPGRCLYSYASGTFKMWTCGDTIADQQWRILDVGEISGNRKYMIRGRESKECAFINADYEMGVYDCHSDYDDQSWYLSPAPDIFPVTFPVNTAVQIHNEVRDRCIYSRARDSLFSNWKCLEGVDDQLFDIVPVHGSVYFRIVSVDTGKCLFSYSDGTWSHWQCSDGTLDQHWLIRDAGHGTYTLRGRVSNECAFVNADHEVGVYDCGSDDQFWKIRPGQGNK